MTIRVAVMTSLLLATVVGCTPRREAESCRTCPPLEHATRTDAVDHSAHAGHAEPAMTTTADSAMDMGPLSQRIASAPAFAKITVPAGVYREATIVITKPVELIAESGAILDGSGTHTVVLVQADDVTIRGFMIRNTGFSQVEERAGIKVSGRRRCRITDNHIHEAAFGVYLEKTSGCVVHANMLQGSGGTQSHNGNGIHAWQSDSVTVTDNRISQHRDGIYFEFVQRGRITGNLSTANARYGLHFMFSDDCEYDGNTYRANGNGVAVMYSKRVVMRGNTFEQNRGSAAYGLLLKDIYESGILANRFLTNSVGLHLEGASRNRIAGNVFSANGLALRVLANAQDNVLEDNDFFGNAFDVATNSRASYSTLRGNYWDRYRGYDLDHDGTGDVPHVPVTLFGLVAEQTPAALVLLRSPFVGLLDLAERAFPALTPTALRDERPRLHPMSAEGT